MTNENCGKLQLKNCASVSIQNIGTRNFPQLACNFSFNSSCSLQQRQLVGSASLLQHSCINRIVLLFSFLCHHHLAECLSPTDNFSLSHTEFREIFFQFHHHDILLFIPKRMTLHLALSSCRNFSTKSLNNENLEVAY